MKKLLISMFLLVALLGCSQKETSTICRYQDYEKKLEYLIKAKGDVVTIFNETTTISLETLEIPEGTDEQSIIDTIYNSFYDLTNEDGVTINVSIEDGNIIVDIKTDLAIADNSTLISLGYLDEDDKDSDYISLVLTTGYMEDDGAVCEVISK